MNRQKIAVPALQIHVIAFDLVHTSLQNIVCSALKRYSLTLYYISNTRFSILAYYYSDSGAMTRIQRAYKSICSLQIFILLFNKVNRHIIFAEKLLCIGCSITGGYAAIAHFKIHPIFGVMYYVIFIDASLIYALVYEKGFQVSDTFQKAKTLLRFHATRNGRVGERKILEKQFMSIPPVGIKVGEFHSLERTSTPVFLHYVLMNVVNMLMAFD